MTDVQNGGQDTSKQTIIINQTEKKSNGTGTAGFVLALIGLFVISWIPILGWIIWLLGFILSFSGIFKSPKGMAIAGLIISLIGVIILIAFAGAVAAMFA